MPGARLGVARVFFRGLSVSQHGGTGAARGARVSTLAGHPLETPAAFAWQKETPGHGKERILLEMPGIVLCGEVQVLPMRSQLSL